MYTQRSVADLLGCAVEDLAELVHRGDLLGMQTSDGVWVYPVFQFTADGIRADLQRVLSRFAGHNGWSVAVWIRTRMDELDDVTPLEWLSSGGHPGAVDRLATRTAHQWTT